MTTARVNLNTGIVQEVQDWDTTQEKFPLSDQTWVQCPDNTVVGATYSGGTVSNPPTTARLRNVGNKAGIIMNMAADETYRDNGNPAWSVGVVGDSIVIQRNAGGGWSDFLTLNADGSAHIPGALTCGSISTGAISSTSLSTGGITSSSLSTGGINSGAINATGDIDTSGNMQCATLTQTNPATPPSSNTGG